MLIKCRKSASADKFAAAVTLVEAMVAMAILAVAVLGASGYRYYAALDSRKASMHRTAAAIALLLCENWRGRGYDHTADFNPATHLNGPELSINVSGVGPDVATGFTLLPTPGGKCQIIVDNAYYWATLSYKDEATPGLRALNVVVGWKQAGSKTEVTTYDANAKLFKLTTYVSN
jgi:Tfp pilus assembly protein PilE